MFETTNQMSIGYIPIRTFQSLSYQMLVADPEHLQETGCFSPCIDRMFQ